jgi:hypothetical protein
VTDLVLVDRLRAVYWPSFLHGWTLDRVLSVEPVASFVPNRERWALALLAGSEDPYDLGRVRYFYEVLKTGGSVDPISVDTHVYPTRGGPPTWGNPFVDDGRHRFVAAVLAECRTIPASCGGLVEQVNWLTGKTKKPPPSIDLDEVIDEGEPS